MSNSPGWELYSNQRVIELPTSGELVVGRDQGVSVSFQEVATLSRRHAKFSVRADGVYVEDLNTLNGTFVRGARISAETKLEPGDLVQFGSLAFEFIPARTRDFVVGQVLSGRYRLTRVLGYGGMGVVYKAHHILIDRAVAIKVIRASVREERHLRAWFLREARATNRVRHPSVVDVQDIAEDGDTLYLVMEYVPGPRLTSVLEAQGVLSVERALTIVIQIAEGLAEAHDRKVVHRDIKPDNVLFVDEHARDDTVKLTDFGLSGLATDPRIEPKNAVFGTPEYMSPEMTLGLETTPQSDQYSLGVLFFEILTKRLPFVAETRDKLMEQHRSAPPPRPSDHRPEVPRVIDHIVGRLLEKDPKRRYQNSHDLVRELRAAQDLLLAARRVPERHPQKWHFFLAYASPDRATAEALYALLSARFRVFLDRKSLLPGDVWARRLPDEQSASHVTLALISEAASSGGFYEREEIARAIALSREAPGRHRVVPIQLDESPLPYGLASVHALKAAPDRIEDVVDALARIFSDLNATYTAYPKPMVDELEKLTFERAKTSASEPLARQHDRQARIDRLSAELRKVPSPREGDTVLGCRLVRTIGKGNFGTVWQASCLESGESRAIKIFDPDRLGLALSVYHFRRGVRAMKHLATAPDRPASICRFLDADDAALAFSMDYLEGGDWTNVKRRGWTLAMKLEQFRSVVAAVRHAHENDVIHRDIKPANIVTRGDQTPVLTDFDIADLLFATQQSAQASGTVCYAAPEQFNDEASHHAAVDVYSLGRLLHFLAIERNPPILFEPVPTLRDLEAQPEWLVRVVRRATAHDPAARYASAAELAADLPETAGSPATVL